METAFQGMVPLFIAFAAGIVVTWFAATILRKYRLHHPTSEQKLLRRRHLTAAEHLIREEWEEARRILTELAVKDSDAVQTYRILGFVLRKLGLHTRSNRVYRSLILRPDQSDVDVPRVFYELAVNQWETKRSRDALESIRKAVRFRPRWAMARKTLTSWLMRLDRWEDAALEREQYEKSEPKAHKTEPEILGRIYAQHALQAARSGDTDKARFALRRAKAELGDHPQVFHAKAVLAVATGNLDTAIEAFREALELSIDCAPIVGWEWFDEGVKHEKKLPFHKWLLRRRDAGDERWTHLLEVRWLLEDGQEEAAQDLLKNHLVRYRHDPHAWNLAQELSLNPERPRPQWKCRHCGAKSSNPSWFCPECQRWDCHF